MENSKTIYRTSGRVVTRRIGSDNLLVPISGGVACENVVFPLNDTGLFVWERLSAGKTLGQAAQDLADRFDVGIDQGLADCEELLERLLAEHLLEEVEA